MANNYQRRIELIVDDIAKDNVEFKAKTITQQNAQKTDMILSISKSIAGLNDVGQNLVLNDIEKEVRENRIDIIDGSGNINVTELTRFTSTLVKAKIDEFERQGINLRLDFQTTRDNSKVSVTETVLSVAVINEMVNNFKNLTVEDRGVLIDNWSSLSVSQQTEVMSNYSDILSDLSSKYVGIDKETVERFAKMLKQRSQSRKARYEKKEKSSKSTEFDIHSFTFKLETFKSKVPSEEFEKFRNYLGKQGLSLSNVTVETIHFLDKAIDDFVDESVMKTSSQFEEADQKQQTSEQPTLSNELSNKMQAYAQIAYVFNRVSKATSLNDLSQIKEGTDINTDLINNQNLVDSQTTDKPSDETLSQEQQLQEEIRQIPSELAKAGYSQEQIIDVLKKYEGTLISLENDDIKKYKNAILCGKKDEVQDEIKDFLVEDGISTEIAVILSKMDFNGDLLDILSSEKHREVFFEQLDIVIENPNRQKPVSDPEYDKKVAEQGREEDLDASAAEASKEQQGRSERTSNVQEEPQEETPTETTTGQADSSTDEHKPQDEAETPPVQKTESSQNMALVEQDNSFLGKIKRTMSKIKSSIKAKVSKFLGKDDKNTIEEGKTTSSEQVEAETTVPELYNTLDRYNYRDTDLEKNALNNFNKSRNTTKEQSERSDTEPGD